MSINNLTVSGYLGSDLKIKTFDSGKIIGITSIPCVIGSGDREKTTWVRCKILGERARKLEAYLKKGSLVTFSGGFHMESWTGKDGEKSIPALLVDNIQLPPKK